MSNRLEFATTPPGVLQDDEALQIETHFDSAPEELKPALASRLLNYKAFRSQFPKPLSAEDKVRRASNFDALVGLAEDWEGTRQKLPPERAEALRMNETSDPETAKRMTWNMAFLGHSMDRRIESNSDYDNSRDSWAVAHFGNIGVGDDAAFYAQAKKSVLTERDENTALFGTTAADAAGAASRESSLVHQVEEAAIKGQPMRTALTNWQRENTGKAHYSPDKMGEYEQLGNDVYSKMTSDLAAAKPVADAAWHELRRDRGEEEGQANIRSIVPLMRSLTSDQQGLVMRLLKDRGESEALPKGFWEATGTALARGEEQRSTEGSETMQLKDVVQARGEFHEGSLVHMGSAVEEVVAREAAGRAQSDFAELGFLRRPTRPLTAEEAQKWNADIEQEIADLETYGTLRKAGADLVDPVKGGGWIRRHIWEPGVESIPLMASMMVPGAEILAMDTAASGYQGEEYRRLRGIGMDPTEAMRTARISGLGQAALDRLEAASLVGKLPGVSRLLAKIGVPTVGLAGAAVRFATISGEQTGIELLQDHLVPALVQDVMASRPEFDPKWAQVWKETAAAAPDTFLGMVLLSGAGAAYGAHAEGAQLKELTSSRAVLRLQGYSLDQIDEIQAAPLNKKGALLEDYRPKEAPTGQERTDMIREAIQLAQEERAKAEQTSSGLRSRALQAGVTISRNDGGWEVRDGAGNTTNHTEFNDAFSAFRNAANESEVRRDEPFLSAIEEFAQRSPAGESFEVRKEGRSLAAVLAQAKIEDDQDTVDAIWSRVEVERAKRGRPDLTPEDLIVLGDSRENLAEGVASYASRIWDGGNVLDLVEEKSENDVKRWVREGRTTYDKMAAMIREVEAATGDTYLHGYDQTQGDSRGNQVAITEAYSDLARAYATGHRRGGAVTQGARGQQAASARALRNKLRDEKDKGTAPPLMKALSDTWQFFKGVLSQARRLGQAKEAGKLGDVEQFLTESVGLSEQRQHNKAVAEASGVDTTAPAAAPGFSLALAESMPIATPSTEADGLRVGTAKLGTDAKPRPTPQSSNIGGHLVPEANLAVQMALVDGYAQTPQAIRDEKDPQKKREMLIEHFRQNLHALIQAFPEELRTRATHWYDGANRIAKNFAEQYQIAVEQAAGVIAVLSPQKDWFSNVAQAEQVIDVWFNHQDTKLTPELVGATLEDIVNAAQARPAQLKKAKPGETKLARTRRRNANERLHEEARTKRRDLLEQQVVGKTIRELDSNSYLQGWAIRLLAQSLNGQRYRVISPEGEAMQTAVNDDGSVASMAWGSIGEIEKAVRILKDGSLENISENLSLMHKVRSFYNNIVAPRSPMGDGTMDTHAVAAAWLLPLGSSADEVLDNFSSKGSSPGNGVNGLYHLYLDAYAAVAKDLGLLPRQVQSIAWEAIRGLFSNKSKNAMATSLDAWKLPDDQARERLLSGGIPPPDWHRPGRDRESQDLAEGASQAGAGSHPGGDLRFRGGPAAGGAGGRGGAAGGAGAGTFSLAPVVKADTGAIKNAEEARASLVPLVGKDLTTGDGGLTANISKTSIGKMVSGSAVQKSASPEAHFAAISEFEKLFESSAITESRPDRNADPNIRAIHRTVARMMADGKPYDVKFTVKELAGVDGNRIYSIEAMEIGDAPERKRVAAYPASGPTSTPQSEASLKDSTDGLAGQAPGPTMSLASADYLEALAPQLQAKGKPPAERRAMYAKAQEQVEGMARAMRFNDETGKPPDRKEMLRSLATLDAILMAFPPDVRGRVGGFAKLASLQTNKAREAYLRTRIEKLDKVLETHLRGQYSEDLKTILDRALPAKNEAGKKMVGKAGAEIHDLFNVLREAKDWDADTVAAHVAGLEAQIAAGNMSPEAEAMAQLEAQLVPLVGDWQNADAARMASAVDAVDSTLAGGLLAWQAKKLKQREERKATRESLMADTGKLGTREQRVAEAERESGVKGLLRRFLINFSSFEEFNHFLFGKDSVKAKEMVTREREASNAKDDELDAMGRGVSDLFTALAGSPLAGEKLRFSMAKQTIDGKQAGKMSPFEAIQATLMWRQPAGQRHMIGKLDENGKPSGPWHYDQAWIDHIEAQLSPEAKAVRQHISDDYAKEWETLNPLYQERHGVSLPRNLNYAPITVAPQQAPAGQMTDPVSGISMTGTSITPGSLRTRSTSAIAEPVFRDALQTFIAHKKQMAHWKSYGDLATDMSAIFGNRELSNTVEAKGGEQSKKVLSGWVDFFAQGGTRDAQAQLAVNQALNRAMGRSAGAALIGRASVLIIQSTQLASAAVEMPTSSYVLRLGKLLSGRLAWTDAIKSQFIQRRLKQMPPLLRQAMEGLHSGKPSYLKHQIARIGTLINGADGLFTAGTYAILFDYHKGKAQEAGMHGAAADSHAHAAAETATERVAQPTRAGTRSLYENTTTNPFARAAALFGSEARQKLMLAGWAATDWRKNPKRAAKALALTWGVGGIGASIIRNAWRDLRDDDDDELFDEKNWSWKRIALASLTGPVQGIPFLGDAVEGGIGKLLGEGKTQKGILEGTTDATDALVSLASGDAFEDDEPIETTARRVESLLSGLAMTNDSIAAAASLAHIVTDAMRIGDALHDDRKEAGLKQLHKEARDAKKQKEAATTDEMKAAKEQEAKARREAKIEAAAQRAAEK